MESVTGENENLTAEVQKLTAEMENLTAEVEGLLTGITTSQQILKSSRHRRKAHGRGEKLTAEVKSSRRSPPAPRNGA